MKTVAKFEKVSFEEWRKCWEYAIYGSEETLVRSYDEIQLPQRATDGSAGYDFFAPVDMNLYAHPIKRRSRPTGIRCKIKPGYFLQLVPKSGLGVKYGLGFVNTMGIIDSDYYNSDNEGHIQATFKVEYSCPLKAGQKMFQGIFLPYYLAEEETPTAKRNGGHGSTGGT